MNTYFSLNHKNSHYHYCILQVPIFKPMCLHKTYRDLFSRTDVWKCYSHISIILHIFKLNSIRKISGTPKKNHYHPPLPRRWHSRSNRTYQQQVRRRKQTQDAKSSQTGQHMLNNMKKSVLFYFDMATLRRSQTVESQGGMSARTNAPVRLFIIF